ncbi:MAG: OB-fold nucleic acid binding domain-containing protein [Candidatus Micrarchaeia archaeon]
MRENHIAVVAFALALAGLVLLYWLSHTARPERVSIASLGSDDVGRFVEVSGFVRKASARDGNVFIELCGGEACVNVVVFEGTARRVRGVNAYALQPGDYLVARGVVREFNWEIEIVVLSSDGLAR